MVYKAFFVKFKKHHLRVYRTHPLKSFIYENIKESFICDVLLSALLSNAQTDTGYVFYDTLKISDWKFKVQITQSNRFLIIRNNDTLGEVTSGFPLGVDFVDFDGDGNLDIGFCTYKYWWCK